MTTGSLMKVEVMQLINPYKPSVLFVGHRETVQNAAYDQVLHCLLTKVYSKI